jgi:CUG-BP- and ETR3-like factor
MSSGGGTEEEGTKQDNEEPEVAAAVDPPEENADEGEVERPSSPGAADASSDAVDPPESPAPMAQPTAYPQMYAPHLTPQQGGGYYIYNQVQVTPEPPSPAGPNGAFRQQQFNPFGNHYTGGLPPPPLSPRVSSMGSLPPASPLFPRVTSNAAGRMSPGGNGAPPSPGPYLASPGLGAAMYPPLYGQSYGISGNGGPGSDVSAEDANGWTNRNSQNLYSQSPQLYGSAGLTRSASAASRTYSFDEMLPPAMLDAQDHAGNPAYSPYGQSTVGASGTLFAQQSWAYGSSGEMYNAPPSPVPPRPVLPHMPGQYGAALRGVPAPPPYGGNYYPATSPGPPIQTTASNKGPDGANLFIFHIPNHFTNLDMYHLFCPYGNLLSVRIMVERDTGRSRGFGFVSYDNPDSAAMAIKELNGFAIGNKRLKVQHKQIRAGEREHYQEHSPSGYHPTGNEYEGAGPYSAGGEYPAAADATSPHSGAGSWYGEPKSTPQSLSPEHALSPEHETENRDTYDEKSPEEEGADVHRSGLGNLDPLRNALPDISGHQGAVK